MSFHSLQRICLNRSLFTQVLFRNKLFNFHVLCNFERFSGYQFLFLHSMVQDRAWYDFDFFYFIDTCFITEHVVHHRICLYILWICNEWICMNMMHILCIIESIYLQMRRMCIKFGGVFCRCLLGRVSQVWSLSAEFLC